MEIKGFIENSMLEWEGRLCCVLFLPRCNLRCRYCHAGHLLEPDGLESIPRGQVLSYMRSQKGWLDGATITGGEPTLHGEELLDLIGDISEAGLEVMVETNGTRPEWVERLVGEGWVQAMTMDLKAPLTPEAYRRVSTRDVDVTAVRRSVKLILAAGLPHEFRITVVPGLVGPAEVEAIAPELEGARMVALQNFQPDNCLDPALREVEPYRPEQMDAMGEVLKAAAERVVLRGRERGVIRAAGGTA